MLQVSNLTRIELSVDSRESEAVSLLKLDVVERNPNFFVLDIYRRSTCNEQLQWDISSFGNCDFRVGDAAFKICPPDGFRIVCVSSPQVATASYTRHFIGMFGF